MQVTNINLFKSNFANEGVVKAYGSVELDNTLVLDVEVCDKGGEDGAWFRFPMTKKVKDKATGQDKYLNRVYVKDKAVLQSIKDELVGKYEREIKFGSGPSGDTGSTASTSTDGQQDFPF